MSDCLTFHSVPVAHSHRRTHVSITKSVGFFLVSVGASQWKGEGWQHTFSEKLRHIVFQHSEAAHIAGYRRDEEAKSGGE